MSYNYSDGTLFELKSDALRFTWAVWYLFVVLSSVVGDTTILYASIKYRVFNLHIVIVTFIQHVAACDLVLAITWVLPNAVSTIVGGQGWSLGVVLNYARVYVCYYCYPVSTLLICALTTFKLFLLKYPLRSTVWSIKSAYKICGGIWLIGLYNPATFLIVDKDDLYYDFRVHTYDYGFSLDIWHLLAPISTFILLLIPNIVTVVATVVLIIKAVKGARQLRKNLRWRGVIMVIVSASVYTFSVLPLTIYSIIEPHMVKNPDQPGPFHVYFYAMAFTVLTLNVIANFFTYLFTVPRFRNFVISRIQKCAPCLDLEVPHQGNRSLLHWNILFTFPC